MLELMDAYEAQQAAHALSEDVLNIAEIEADELAEIERRHFAYLAV